MPVPASVSALTPMPAAVVTPVSDALDATGEVPASSSSPVAAPPIAPPMTDEERDALRKMLGGAGDSFEEPGETKRRQQMEEMFSEQQGMQLQQQEFQMRMQQQSQQFQLASQLQQTDADIKRQIIAGIRA